MLIIATSFTFENEIVELIIPKNWPKTEFDFNKTPLTRGKIALGRSLFYDPILSKNKTISCASCHLSYTAFTHVDHPLSHGIDDKIGTRNSPVLINLAWNKSFMWDGSVNHIDVQALAPISHAAEMGEDLGNVVQKLNNSLFYKNRFFKAFGDSIITGEYLLKALAQFQLTLVSANSKYDKVERGEEQFTNQELKGKVLFNKNCSSCHTPPLFTSGNFENNGLPIDTTLNDLGRVNISLNPSDSLKFKVPTLRNIEFSFPYMHDGRFRTLYEVMNHYETGIHKTNSLAPQLKNGIKLSDENKTDIISFLLTLSDKEFLFNQNHAYPRNELK